MNFARWILILLVLCTSPALAEPAPELVAEPVAHQVWYLRGNAGPASAANRGYTSNAGFVVTQRGVLVFDALGTPALAQAMLAAIASVTEQPVRRVIVSHYHADHIYGLQAFKAAGAEIWARSEGRIYLNSDRARDRLSERRRTLSPWIDELTHLAPADRWIELAAGQSRSFSMGGTDFRLISAGHAHAPDDLMLLVAGQIKPRAGTTPVAQVDRGGSDGSRSSATSVLFAGDLYFNGRLPFVVDGNTRAWLTAINAIQALGADCIVPGHGALSCTPTADLNLTADYLRFLRTQMGAAVEQLTEFDEAYAAVDWTRFADLPTFAEANRRNAYSVYLEMQAELLSDAALP